MLKIVIAFRDADAAHKAGIMLQGLPCPNPLLHCGLCSDKDACAPLMELIRVLLEVKDDASKH